jgi:hypothetical protein
MLTVSGHKEMKIKTSLRFYLTPVVLATIKNATNNKCWWGFGEKGTLIHCWWECKLVQPLWKTTWRLLKKTKSTPAIWSINTTLGIYPKDCESDYYKGTCTALFIAALFIIAKLWKQPRCPTTDKQIKKIWYLYTMEFYSATKKNEILSFTCKWLELENIILSMLVGLRRPKNHMFSLTCGL